jgi:hypothetical protein
MPYSATGEWKPNPKQAIFLALPTSIKEAFYGGGAGSGKSDVLLLYALIRGWWKNPLFKQVFLRRTFPELRNEIVPRSREYYRPFGAKFNASEMVWKFPREDQYGATADKPDGAHIFLGHCENEDDVHKYDSMEIQLFTPDELTSHTEWIYLYIGFQRVRAPKNSGLPEIIRGAGMPGNIGHTWVKKRFVDHAPKGGIPIEGKGGNLRIFIFATQADNPHVSDQYAKSLEALPEAEKKAKLYGDFDAYVGQVFDEFRDRNYPDEPDNALHVIEPFDIPDWWPKFIVGDWGFAASTWVGFFAVSPKRRLYLYRELSWRKVKIEEWAPYVREYADKENPRIIKFCRSAAQDRGQEHTIQQQIEDALERPIELSNNSPGSRIAGKLLLHEYLRWKPKNPLPKEERIYDNDHAMWLMRNRGLNAYHEYLRSFDKPPDELLPKYQIFNTCPLAVNSIKSCVYAKSKEGVPSEDVAEFDGDDPYDGQRYGLDTAERFFIEAEQEMKEVERRQEIMDRLTHTQDWTAFFRMHEKLEADSNSIYKPVRRFHHR